LSIFESHHSGELLQATLPAAGAAVAQDQAIGRSPITGTVVGASVISEAAVTANGTNYRTIRVLNKGQDGLGTTVVASLALDTPGTDNLVAFDEKALDLSGTAANLNVNQGDILVADETVTASGLAHSGYKVQVQVVRQN
jgi:hypothetical protein